VTGIEDTNHVYVRGKPDIKGTYAGWWDHADLSVFNASLSDTPVTLRLVPSSLESTKYFQGLSYVDIKIAVDAAGAIGVNGNILAAGSWTLPS
jgi:hypothetical protein